MAFKFKSSESIEAGTQRMRDVINKNVTEEQLLETAERIFSKGWGKMKLYFMIGLPGETMEDVETVVDERLSVRPTQETAIHFDDVARALWRLNPHHRKILCGDSINGVTPQTRNTKEGFNQQRAQKE